MAARLGEAAVEVEVFGFCILRVKPKRFTNTPITMQGP